MSSFLWWRSWHGAPTDPKWAVIAVRSGVKVGVVSAVAWALMDYASQCKERGSVAGFDTETYAVYSGFDETEIVAVIKAMCNKGIIADGHLANWAKRQPQREDDSNARVHKHREMKRSVTQSNAQVEDETIDSVSSSTSLSDSVSLSESESLSQSCSQIFQAYEHEIGLITPAISNEILDFLDDTPAEYFVTAFDEAAKNNKRSWAYAKAILKRLRVEGIKPKSSGQRPTGTRTIILPDGSTSEATL